MSATAGAEPDAGRLIVCPTPIGNLEDITLRVLAALREADVVACEDTRRTRILLDRYGVSAKLVSYHEHNESERATELVGRMRAGLWSRWCPTPACRWSPTPASCSCGPAWPPGLGVEVLPGPSAALSALVASALPAERWQFVGFLPRKRAELERVLAQPETLVAFESPRRVGRQPEALAALDPERPVAVCRELTKIHEEIVRGTAAELAERYAGAGPQGRDRAGRRARAPATPGLDAPLRLRRLVDAGAKPRPAAGVVAELTGVSANALYRALNDL